VEHTAEHTAVAETSKATLKWSRQLDRRKPHVEVVFRLAYLGDGEKVKSILSALAA
jgi:hypothetical protein